MRRGPARKSLGPGARKAPPRFRTAHHVGSFRQPPRLDSLGVDEALGAGTAEALEALGHRVRVVRPPIGAPASLRIDAETGQVDPRAGRHAAAP